jgi:hypothetical protein
VWIRCEQEVRKKVEVTLDRYRVFLVGCGEEIPTLQTATTTPASGTASWKRTSMSQFYARVFVQILDSSIAEDFMVRHVFEDMLKVCDMRGVVDMTRPAMARRFNVPLGELNRALAKLEAPDEHSRDGDHDGRRLERLDEHRDWGWRILNWGKYEQMRTRADVAVRVAKHRAARKPEPAPGEKKSPESEGGDGVTAPTERTRGANHPANVQEVAVACEMLCLDPLTAKPFFDYYESTAKEGINGEKIWRTGSEENWKVVGNWKSLLSTWNNRDRARKQEQAVNPKGGRKEVNKEQTPQTAPKPKTYGPGPSTIHPQTHPG